MKKILGAVGIIIMLFGIWMLAGARFEHYAKKRLENTYSQKFEYKDTKRIAELKDEVETLRVKALRLQASLDSCRYDIKEEVAVTPKVIYKSKKDTKALDDCKEEVVKVKAMLGQCIGDKAKMEVEKDLQINLLKRQMDTCAYFVQEMDKALNNASKQVTDLTNERDSLKSVLITPLTKQFDFPCIKTKKGLKIAAFLNPERELSVTTRSLEKKEYKAVKKSCKKAQSR